MKPVVRYQADDGSLWLTEEDALAREEFLGKRDAFMRELGLLPRPSDRSFTDGRTFVQQPKGARERLRDWVREHAEEAAASGPAAGVALRLCCIDERDREWAQPYFAGMSGKEGNHV